MHLPLRGKRRLLKETEAHVLVLFLFFLGLFLSLLGWGSSLLRSSRGSSGSKGLRGLASISFSLAEPSNSYSVASETASRFLYELTSECMTAASGG